jgi:hypothetical protein
LSADLPFASRGTGDAIPDRLIEDMSVRRLDPKTQRQYLPRQKSLPIS